MRRQSSMKVTPPLPRKTSNSSFKTPPQNPLGYIKLGQLRSQQKRWSEAEDSYRQALSRNPNSLSATEGLVAVDFARNRPADAVRLLQAEIERTSGSSALFFLLGQAQLRNGEAAEAGRSLTRSISLDNRNMNAIVLMAELQASGGNFEQGIAGYQRAIEFGSKQCRALCQSRRTLRFAGGLAKGPEPAPEGARHSTGLCAGGQ